MRLLAVELTRLRWRRAVLVLLAACVLIPAVIWVATWWNTRPASPEDLARAEAEIAAMADEPWVREEMRMCVERPGDWGVRDTTDVEAACRAAVLPTPEDYVYRPGLNLRDQVTGSATGVITLLAALLLLIGTTFVGHDWNTGSMSNQLLFEPRRTRVWLAKAAVLLFTGVVVSAAVLAAYWTGLWLLAGARDLPPVPGIGDQVRDTSLRGIALCGFAAVLGYALTTLFRSTVATLGVVFVVAIVGSFLVLAIGGPGAEPWMLHANVAAFLHDGYQYFVDEVCLGDTDVSCGERTLSQARGAAYLSVILGASCLLSWWSFGRRDIP